MRHMRLQRSESIKSCGTGPQLRRQSSPLEAEGHLFRVAKALQESLLHADAVRMVVLLRSCRHPALRLLQLRLLLLLLLLL